MNYSTTNSSGTSSVTPGVGHFVLFPVPYGGAFVTNPHLYPSVRGIGTYFDWCTSGMKGTHVANAFFGGEIGKSSFNMTRGDEDIET